MKRYKKNITTERMAKVGDTIRRYSKGGTPTTFEVYKTTKGIYPFCSDAKKYIYYKVNTFS